jgi:hypothetical protein
MSDTATFVAIGQHYWGKGNSAARARSNFRRQGGLLGRGYTLLEFPPGTEFKGVDMMGYVHWVGAEPTATEYPPRKAKP